MCTCRDDYSSNSPYTVVPMATPRALGVGANVAVVQNSQEAIASHYTTVTTSITGSPITTQTNLNNSGSISLLMIVGE